MSDILMESGGPEPEDDEFDSPNGSKWIVAVDQEGFVTILDRPNIHWSFFECGNSAEDVGLPFEVESTAPGVYEWICDYSQSRCPETDLVDGGEFEVREEKCLWALPKN